METYQDIISAYGLKKLVADFGARAYMMSNRGRIPSGDWEKVIETARAAGTVIPEGAFERAERHFQKSKKQPSLRLQGGAS